MQVHLTSYILMLLLAVIAKTSESSIYGTFELRLRSIRPDKGISEGALWTLCLTNFQENLAYDSSCRFSATQTASTSALRSGVSLPFDFAWPGSFSLFIRSREVYSLSSPYSKEDLVFEQAFASKDLAGSRKNEVELVDEKLKTTVVLEYQIVCSEGHVGRHCGLFCPSGGKILSCTNDGNVTCASGWKGDKCDEAICDGCQRNGQCVGPGVCKCDIGWTGPNCDQCLTRPGCKHGICQNPNDCICDKGWGGIFCDEDLEYCAHHKPCSNGATCLNKGNGSYACDCRPGYTGLNCETEQQTCLISGWRNSNQDGMGKACQNGGRCMPDSTGEHHCECPSGYTGDYCQKCSHCCVVDGCLNGGTCTLNGSLRNYVCDCPPGFTGSRCENVISVCADLCLNGGTCVRMSGQFVCKCRAGFEGPFCEKAVNPCEKNPCENNGWCSVTEDGLYKCQCGPGYQGRNCDIGVLGCEQQPCGNGSTCIPTSSGYECHCGPCYTGPDCRTVDEHCLIKMSHTWNSLIASFLIVIAVLTFLILVVLLIFLWWKRRTHQSIVDPITENMINVRRSRLCQLPSVDPKLDNSACDASTLKYKPVSVSRLKAVTQCNHYEDHQRRALGSHNRLNLKNLAQSVGEPQGDEDLYAEVDDSPYNTDFPPLADNYTAKLSSELRDFSLHNYDRRLHFSKCPDVHTNV